MTVTECKGCGARLGVAPGEAPGTYDVFHPAPLCKLVLDLIGEGRTAGPVREARLDMSTGTIVADDEGGAVVTLRFRNRFKSAPSELRVCDCGGRVSFTVVEQRETVIHELPWCARFEALMREIAAIDAGEGKPITPHVALVNVADRETVVVADGDSVDDVNIEVEGGS